MIDRALGQFRLDSATRGMGQVAFCAAMMATVALQRWQRPLRRREAAVWWASNGRDLLNGISLALITFCLALMGFPGPSALLVGATLLLPIVLLGGFLDRSTGRVFPNVILWGVAFVLTALIEFYRPERVHLLTNIFIEVFF